MVLLGGCKMAFRVVHARYDEKSKRAYVELRDADDDGGEMLATAVFSEGFKARGRAGRNQKGQVSIQQGRYGSL